MDNISSGSNILYIKDLHLTHDWEHRTAQTTYSNTILTENLSSGKAFWDILSIYNVWTLQSNHELFDLW